MKLTEESTILEITQSREGRAVLEQYLPKLVRSPAMQMTYAMSFRAVCKFRRWKLKRRVYEQAVTAIREIEQ